jgi:hypothetical protein
MICTMFAVAGFVHVPLDVNTWTLEPAAAAALRRLTTPDEVLTKSEPPLLTIWPISVGAAP